MGTKCTRARHQADSSWACVKFDVQGAHLTSSKINCQHFNLVCSPHKRAGDVDFSKLLMFIGFPRTEDAGIGVRMWLIWELANTADSDSRRAHKQTLSCGFSSHTLRTVNVKHACRRTQILLISLQEKKRKKEWPRLGGNKGGGFASRIGWGSTLVDLCTVCLHWKPRRCESPALRRYPNTGAICRGAFNSLQSDDWLLSPRPLRGLSQWIL